MVRIVSLLPSITEILFALGGGDDVVGVTFECNFPPEARSRRIVSISALLAGLTPAQIDTEVRSRLAAGQDLYRLDADALGELDPDLILTQDLCAVCAVDVGTVDAALVHLAAGRRCSPSTRAPRRADRLRELRLRAGRSAWRGFYRRLGDVFVIAAIGPEAQADKRGFGRAVAAAQARLDVLEEGLA